MTFMLAKFRSQAGRLLLALGLTAGSWTLAGTAKVAQGTWVHGACALTAAREDGVAELGDANWEWTLVAGGGSLRHAGGQTWYQAPPSLPTAGSAAPSVRIRVRHRGEPDDSAEITFPLPPGSGPAASVQSASLPAAAANPPRILPEPALLAALDPAKRGLDSPIAVTYLGAVRAGKLQGKWLAGDKAGLILLSLKAGRIKVERLPGSPAGVTAVAARQPGTVQGSPLAAVFLADAPPRAGSRRKALYGLDDDGTIRPLSQARKDGRGPRVSDLSLPGSVCLALGRDGSVVVADDTDFYRIRRIYPDGHVVYLGGVKLRQAAGIAIRPMAMAMAPGTGQL